MKIVFRILVALLLLLVVCGTALYVWASRKDAALLSRHIESHHVDFPIPFPLSDEAIAQLEHERTGSASRRAVLSEAELDSVARARALERGHHLVTARYGCVECHGMNFGGGTMVDDPMIGRILGPNITTGRGSRTTAYTAADWDRAVRHGIKPDGTPSAMPAEDFQRMSDRELSDIVVYIRSHAPVDSAVPRVKLGPLGTMLMAFGQLPLSADMIKDHQSAHEVTPPPTAVTVEFGQHVASVCAGCHRADFTGGPIPGGPPDWAPAANLTPHADGLSGWTYEQFVTALRQGMRPDGTALRPPMTLMMPYAQNMTDIEMQALWLYLQSLPPKPSPTK